MGKTLVFKLPDSQNEIEYGQNECVKSLTDAPEPPISVPFDNLDGFLYDPSLKRWLKVLRRAECCDGKGSICVMAL